MVKELSEYVKIFEKMDFHNLVVSLKANDVATTVAANRIYSRKLNYPVHLGVTEAGTEFSGLVKSSAAFGILLNEGIGDTVRVSLTAGPEEEVKAGWEILKALGLRKRGVEIISCPTCARCETDLIGIVRALEKKLSGREFAQGTSSPSIRVAVMGCSVNGPGEARDADVGITGGRGFGLLVKKGKIIKKIPQKKFLAELLKEIKNVQKKI